MSLTSMSRTRRVNAFPGRASTGKCPWIRRVRGSKGLAGALLLAASMLSGCLLPQDDYVLPGTPEYLNHAPRFVTVDPAKPFISTGNVPSPPLTPCPLDFTVTAADEDVADILRVRFYVDYDPVTNQGYEREFEFALTGSAERAPVTWESDVSKAGNPLGYVTTSIPHLVEAVLFDGSLGPNRQPDPRNVSDAGVNPSYAVIHQWVVQTTSETCP